MSASWLEVRIAISPTDFFFNRVHFIALSIKSLGGRYADTVFHVVVGADEEPYDLHERLPWSRELGIEWRWVDRREFIKWKDSHNPYLSTIVERFRPPFTACHVLVLDPDVIAMAPFDDLIEMLETEPAVYGVMAHLSPFISKNVSEHSFLWDRLYHAAGLAKPKFDLPYTGWGIYDFVEERRFGPPYLNSGMIFAPSELLEKMWPSYVDGIRTVRSIVDTYYYDQIGFTLALVKSGAPYFCVPLKYNFPNEPAFDVTFAAELADIRFLHFMRTVIVDRDSSFKDFSSISKFVGRRDLTGSNEALRRRVAQLLPLAMAVRPNEC